MSRVFLFLGLVFFICGNAFAEEGMWTYDNPPVKDLKEKYQFEPTKEWLDHLRFSSVRLMDGGSASFVSPDGLIMTNHHVLRGQLFKISTPENNLIENGFYADAYDKEIKCPDLEANILLTMENVTDKVIAVAKDGMSEHDVLKANEKKIARIEKEGMDKTGLKSTVVTLYNGGEYWLYQYKKYTDIRLVFAPEMQTAHFGGDSDNFTYPRYNLDCSFVRAYENDKPVKSDHYLKWSTKGVQENDLVFVSGNPGSTQRLSTMNQLLYMRDHMYPLFIKYFNRIGSALEEYSKRGEEQNRRAYVMISGMNNGLKSISGIFKGLSNEKLINQKRKDEEEFKKLVNSKPQWKEKYGDAWDIIDEVVEKQKKHFVKNLAAKMRGSKLAGMALQIVQYASEIEKPNEERLNGYHDSQLESFKFRMMSKAPFYKDMEIVQMIAVMELIAEYVTMKDPLIKAMVGDKTIQEAVTHMLTNTKLDDPEYRKTLMEGGKDVIGSCQDPLIEIARKIDPIAREIIEFNKKNIESRALVAREKLANARFAVYGKTMYPDATFTLRFSYGSVKGYPMNGTKAPIKTTLHGLFNRSLGFDKKGEFALSQRYWDNVNKLDLATPVNFVSTNDVVGGNSGSPIVNKHAEVVGLIFDGNIESLTGGFIYDAEHNRTVSVCAEYIIEALQKLYGADKLAKEILGQ